MIIITTLFQEDSIFGTNSRLTYGPQIQRHTMRLIMTERNEFFYSMYRAGEVSVHRAFCEQATQPTRLEGGGGRGGTINSGSRPAGVTTRSPRMVTECLLTQSKLSSSELLSGFYGLVFSTYFDDLRQIQHLGISDLRLPSDRRTILIGRGPHLAMISSTRKVLI